MRILFDHDVPAPLRRYLSTHEVSTCDDLGWEELHNGNLLKAADAGGFDLFITCDQNMRSQRNLTQVRMSILQLNTQNWPVLQRKIRAIQKAVARTTPESGFRELASKSQELPPSKTAFLAPKEAELTVSIDMGARPKVTLSLNLGIPTMTRFAISVPVDGLDNAAIESYSRQAFDALLDDTAAFLLSLKFEEARIAEVIQAAHKCFENLSEKDASDAGMTSPNKGLIMYEGHFPLPPAFVDETRSKVITAAKVDITQTPGFKGWFSGSEVVDAQGKPLVMYHATRSDIGEFHAFTHFGTMAAANDRHGNIAEFEDFKRKREPTVPEGANIIPVYLSIKNPLRLPDLAAINDRGETIADLDEYDRNLEYGDEGYDDDESMRRYPVGWEGEEAIATTLLEMGEIDTDEFEDHRSNTKALKLLAEKGYDGIVYKNVVEDAGNDSWIVFHPSQIKSAIGNSGAFDSGSNSITAAVEQPGAEARGGQTSITAASSVRRIPEVREINLAPLSLLERPDEPSAIIQMFRDQTTRSTPWPFKVNVQERMPSGETRPADWMARLVVAK